MKEKSINIIIPTWLSVLLTVIFVTLKLTGYINWDWFLVFSPILVPICFGLMIATMALFITIIGLLTGKFKLKRK